MPRCGAVPACAVGHQLITVGKGYRETAISPLRWRRDLDLRATFAHHRRPLQNPVQHHMLILTLTCAARQSAGTCRCWSWHCTVTASTWKPTTRWESCHSSHSRCVRCAMIAAIHGWECWGAAQKGLTPLLHAVRNGHTAAAEFLCRRGALADTPDLVRDCNTVTHELIMSSCY